MTDKPSAINAKDYDVMISRAERELASRRAIIDIASGDPDHLQKIKKEIEEYEAHIVDLKQRRQKHV